MKYLSIDLETTHLKPEKGSIIEIGYVFDDINDQKDLNELLHGSFFITPKDEFPIISFSTGTLEFHLSHKHGPAYISKYLKELNEGKTTKFEDAISYITDTAFKFFGDKKFTIAGKNYKGFDENFIKNYYLESDGDRNIGMFLSKSHHRCIDPGSMYIDFSVDEEVPSTEECMRRVGIEPSERHTALGDAWDICRLIRFKANQNKND